MCSFEPGRRQNQGKRPMQKVVEDNNDAYPEPDTDKSALPIAMYRLQALAVGQLRELRQLFQCTLAHGVQHERKHVASFKCPLPAQHACARSLAARRARVLASHVPRMLLCAPGYAPHSQCFPAVCLNAILGEVNQGSRRSQTSRIFRAC